MEVLKLTEKHYHVNLHASEYDMLEVIESAEDGRITLKGLNEGRWRTKEEMIAYLEEIAGHIKNL